MNAVTETNIAPVTQADWTAKIRAYYTNPSATVARLAECTTTVERLDRARTMLATARNPGFRFGLTNSDIPTEVVIVLEATVSESQAALKPFATRMRKLVGQGYAMDETWNKLDDAGAGEHGLRYGHSSLLLSV
jgi:hypothetical protein